MLLATSRDQPGTPLDMEGAIDESSGCNVETSASKSRPPLHRHSTAESAVSLTSSQPGPYALLAGTTSLIRWPSRGGQGGVEGWREEGGGGGVVVRVMVMRVMVMVRDERREMQGERREARDET